MPGTAALLEGHVAPVMLSVIIVNHNGRKYLPRCLDSTLAQKGVRLEVVLVDNGSKDGSAEFVRANYDGVTVVESRDNLGYASGSNLGYKSTRGEFVLIMNNDTYFENDDSLVKLLGSFDFIPNLGVVQPKIRLMDAPDKLDACGSFWTNTGFNYHYGIYKPEGLPKYNSPFRVYSLKGVCMLTRRSIIEECGLFDDDFWCYFEETDFCHRIGIAGYESWYNPEVVIYHKMGGTRLDKQDVYVQFHSFKNRLCSYLKNLSLGEMARVLPLYLTLNVGLSAVYLAKGRFEYAAMLYRAMWWNLAHLGETRRKRQRIQGGLRKLTDQGYFAGIRINPAARYYLCLLSGLEQFEDQPVG